MSAEKEAGVRVKLTGDEEIAASASKMSSAWGEVGSKASSAFKSMGREVSGAVQGVLSDLGHVVSAAGAINFAASVQSVDRLEESVARMGVASGRSITSVQQNMNALAQEIGEMPEATTAWVNTVGSLTYSYERAAGAAKGLAEYAAETGQSTSEVAPLAVLLDQIGAGGEKAANALGTMAAQAKMLGRGSVREVGDELAHLQGQISNLSASDGAAKISALVAGFGGAKGFTPQQRERALGGVLSKVEGSAEGFERFLGHSITDEYGHIKNMTGTLAELQKYGKQGKGQQRRLEFTLGKEGAAALMHTDFTGIHDAEKALADGAGAHALERLKGTPAGVRKQQEIDKSIAMQGVVGSDSFLGGLRNTVGDWASKSPLLTGAGLMVGSKLLGAGMSAGGKALFGAATGGGGAVTGGAATAAEVGGGSLMAGIGLSGLAAGGTVLGGLLMTGKVLTELGAASKAKQGFSNRAIGGDEAAALSDRAAAANAAAESNQSPGMKEAIRLEKERLQKQRDAQANAGGGAAGTTAAAGAGGAAKADPRMQGLVDQMVKAGQSLQFAQETAAKMIAMQGTPIQIEVVNSTGGEVDARVRGQQ